MKPVNFLSFVMLALLQLANASALVPRQDSDCNLATITLCIVNLGELPLSITACTDIAEDISSTVESAVQAGESSESGSSSESSGSSSSSSLGNNIAKLAVQGADCIVEASMEVQDLSEHCVTCAKAIQSAAGGGDS